MNRVAAMLRADGFRMTSKKSSESGGGVLRYQRDLLAADLNGNDSSSVTACPLDRLPRAEVDTTNLRDE